jgi:amino acid adenylation domain-containing protein
MKELLNKIKQNNVFLELENGKLKLQTGEREIAPELLEEIKIRKLEIIEFLTVNRESIVLPASFAPIAPLPKSESYALSPVQRAFWLLSMTDESNVAYNSSLLYQLQGKLDPDKLTIAFRRVIERHEILRTVFRENEKCEIRQYIKPCQTFDFAIRLWDERKTESNREYVRSLVERQTQHPFDLATGPLLKVDLYRTGEEDWILSVIIHHIISDGWSMDNMIGEVIAGYKGLLNDHDVVPESLLIQYKDYAGWLLHQLLSGVLSPQKEYWLKEFEDGAPVLELHTDFGRPDNKTFNGGVVQRIVDTNSFKAIQLVWQEEGCTLFMGLYALVNALLFKYTHQEDIVMGCPVAGRSQPELNNQIGAYLNMVAIRTRFSENDSYRELLGIVKKATLNAFENQMYPFDELVDALGVRKDMSRNPLFDVMISLENKSGLGLKTDDLAGLQVIELEGQEVKSSQLDLSFDFREIGGEIQLTINFNTDLYLKSTIQSLADHLFQILREVTENPGKKLNELQCLDKVDEERLLQKLNPPAFKQITKHTLVSLFEEQAAANAGKIAVVWGDLELTYKELNEKANQLGAYLRTRYSVKQEDLIGILLPKSEQLIVAILGVLKSGAAYVPLDPSYPEERTNFMIKDCQCKVVVTETLLDDFYRNAVDAEKTNLLKVNTPNDLAYVIYTSGSTGNPKGVQVEHRNIMNVHYSWKEAYKLDTMEINLLQLASVSFDVFMGDICRSILNGGKLIFCPDDVKLNPEGLIQILEQHRISILEGTPGILLPLLEELAAKKRSLESLCMLIFGSEALSFHSFCKVRKQLGTAVRIVNSYGTTETTIDSAFFEGEGAACYIRSLTPIGKPFANTELYVLNKQGQLTPRGVAGEICIGGYGVARGYLNNPELTEKKFVQNPFIAGTTLYKTGDMGRWMPDGNLEFIGRADEQVKIRGYRIELGEIQNALLTHSCIRSALVITLPDLSGDHRLIAYCRKTKEVSFSVLRNYLEGKLPSYMIPSCFIEIAEFPLTVNGKINRMKLPPPDYEELMNGTEYVAPSTPTERTLTGIWAGILGVEQARIGTKDDFFTIGGHSLKASRLASLVHKEFDVKMPLRDFFITSVLEEQASLIDLCQWKQGRLQEDLKVNKNAEVYTF